MDHNSSHSSAPAGGDKFDTGKPYLPVENLPPLPESYGDNRLVLLPRDPLWFFSYWDFTGDRMEKVRQEQGAESWDQSILVLRVYDVTTLPQNGVESAPFFDIDLPNHLTRQTYVNVPEPAHSWVAELGLRLPGGKFIALLRSNRIRLPAGEVSNKTDLTWMATTAEEELEQFKKLSEGADPTGRGSSAHAKNMAQRWAFLKSVFSGSSSNLSGASPWIDKKDGKEQ